MTASMVVVNIMHYEDTGRLKRSVVMYVISSRAGLVIAWAVGTPLCLIWLRLKSEWAM